MSSYSSSTVNQKNCSTCQYWKADRSISINHLQVAYIYGEKFPCGNAMASKKAATSGNEYCYKWAKWIMI
jgi:hypothetical protein